jgi:hypothetical protein
LLLFLFVKYIHRYCIPRVLFSGDSIGCILLWRAGTYQFSLFDSICELRIFACAQTGKADGMNYSGDSKKVLFLNIIVELWYHYT